jgi:hypothetical protein
MNILIFEEFDHSGAGYALAQAVNEYTEHVAQQVVFEQSYLRYDADIEHPSRNRVRELWEWADVVNIHDRGDKCAPWDVVDRPMFSTYHGSEYRQRWPYFNAWDRNLGRIGTALNLDLVMLGPRWTPRPVPDLSHLRNGHENNGDLHVVHAPTNRQIKDTQTVIDSLVGLDGVRFELIEGVSNEECIARKARADLLIEEFKLGYGTNALECWSMGMPVISDAFGGILSYMQFRLKEFPFIRTPLGDLRERVEHLRDNRAELKRASIQGRTYWAKYHKPEVAAKRYVEIAQEQHGRFYDNGGT